MPWRHRSSYAGGRIKRYTLLVAIGIDRSLIWTISIFPCKQFEYNTGIDRYTTQITTLSTWPINFRFLFCSNINMKSDLANVTIKELTQNTRYNVTASTFSAQFRYHSLRNPLVFETISSQYHPTKVDNNSITVSYLSNTNTDNTVSTTISWRPNKGLLFIWRCCGLCRLVDAISVKSPFEISSFNLTQKCFAPI